MNQAILCRILPFVLLTGSSVLRTPLRAPSDNRPDTLQALQPPQDQQLILHWKGTGVQIYVCRNSGDIYQWQLKAPDAQLVADSGDVAGRHFAGPTWEANDGSRVVGKVVASAPAAEVTAIPWLLLTAISHDGSGVLQKVQSIQRLQTRGGVAPAGSCDAVHLNREASVPYTANYYFYGSHAP